MRNIRLLVIVFIYVGALANAQNVCNTYTGETGICVAAKRCSVFVNILNTNSKPFSARITEYIRRSHCGTFDNVFFVCCSSRHVTAEEKPTPTRTTTSRPTAPTPQYTGPANINYNNDRCGIVNKDKISNGDNTELSEFPWMAALEYESDIGERKFQCGGALITPSYVLTAAHCVTLKGVRLISVRLGEHDLTSDSDCEIIRNRRICAPPVENIPVHSVIVHPTYNTPRFANDVALVRMTRQVELAGKSHINTICLPTTSQLQSLSPSRLLVSGWGFTNSDRNSQATILQKAILPVKPIETCQQTYGNVKVTEKQLCAGSENRVDTCKGDSGSPLFFPSPLRGVRFVQFGIVSAGGNSCGGPQVLPGLYTRVTSYVDWITSNLRE